MARTRSEKQETVQIYQDGLAAAPHAFLVGFKGITVPQVTDLRDRVREHGGQYEVVKNTLALIAHQRSADGRSQGPLHRPYGRRLHRRGRRSVWPRR